MWNFYSLFLLLFILSGCSNNLNRKVELKNRFKAYLAASQLKDEFHPDYLNFRADTVRTWFYKKEGSGNISVTGIKKKGWWEWDKVMQSTNSYDSLRIDLKEGKIWTIFKESNDYYSFFGISSKTMKTNYWLNSEGKILEILYEPDPFKTDPSYENRFAIFYQWALQHSPEVIQKICPNERIIPSTENAQLFKSLFEEYKQQKGGFSKIN